MYIQEKVAWNADVEKKLAHLKTLGVDCIAVDLPDPLPLGSAIDLSTVAAATEFMMKARKTVEAHGMELKTVLATSGYIDIKKGTAGRDRQIESLVNAIPAMGAAGIPILAYNFKVLLSKHLRSEPTQGRGAAQYISFDYDGYLKKPAAPVDPPISEEQMWDNLAYFLKAVIPTAEKCGVRLALHPDDPPVPHGIPPLAGVAHIACSFDQDPQDLRHRSFAVQRHALLSGLHKGDEGRERLRCHSGDGLDRQDRHGSLSKRARLIPEIPGDVRR